jgi:hypothetical protein
VDFDNLKSDSNIMSLEHWLIVLLYCPMQFSTSVAQTRANVSLGVMSLEQRDCRLVLVLELELLGVVRESAQNVNNT